VKAIINQISGIISDALSFQASYLKACRSACSIIAAIGWKKIGNFSMLKIRSIPPLMFS